MKRLDIWGQVKPGLVAIVLIALLLGIGIGWLIKPAPEVPAPEAPAKPTLTVFSLWSGDEEKAFKEVLAGFTKNSGIGVKHIPQTTEGLMIGMPVAFMAGRSPADVVLAPWPAWIRDLAKEGHIMPATGLVVGDEYSPTHLDELKVGGVLYGTPFKMAGKPGFWYRVSFFAQHGLTKPGTYEEFKALLAKLKGIPGIEAPIASGNGVGWPLSDTTEAFIMGLGDPQLQLDLIASKVAWTSPEVKAVFGKLAELLKARYFSVPAEWVGQKDKLWEGKYGIYFMGDWIAGMVPDATDLDFFPFPGTKGAAGAIDYAFVPKYAMYPEEAKELLKYLATAEAQQIWVKLGGFIAPNLKVPAGLYTPTGRVVLEFLKGVRVVPDLDDAIGGMFQTTFWDQLKLLWVKPAELEAVLTALDKVAPKPK